MEIEEDEDLVYTPDELEDDPGNGLSCFKDQHRQCGPDCMAYLGLGQTAPSKLLNSQQATCLELVTLERTARSTTIAAQLLKELLDRGKNNEADRKRAEAQQANVPFQGQGQT